mmetsp:Transcript_15682/g.61254  ORF Transcript_15682/g.61254 Transcript_15682/m.61254 type:complete len:245 (-) Transcript_15682:492-1226(-)
MLDVQEDLERFEEEVVVDVVGKVHDVVAVSAHREPLANQRYCPDCSHGVVYVRRREGNAHEHVQQPHVRQQDLRQSDAAAREGGRLLGHADEHGVQHLEVAGHEAPVGGAVGEVVRVANDLGEQLVLAGLLVAEAGDPLSLRHPLCECLELGREGDLRHGVLDAAEHLHAPRRRLRLALVRLRRRHVLHLLHQLVDRRRHLLVLLRVRVVLLRPQRIDQPRGYCPHVEEIERNGSNAEGVERWI